MEMNFGTVSLAAPQASSSRVSRYSRSDRRVLAMAFQSTSDPAAERCLLASAAHQAGIDRKGSPVDQPFGHAAPDHGLEQLSQQTAVTEAAMPILGEGRVVRHLAVEAEPTEPAVGEVQVNLLAQPPFRTNAVAVANQQHPDEQLGINRRPASRAVKWRQVVPNI